MKFILNKTSGINQIENMCVNIVTAKREGWK